MAADRREERQDRDVGEEVPELLDRGGDRVQRALTVSARFEAGCGATGTKPARVALDGGRCLTPPAASREPPQTTQRQRRTATRERTSAILRP
jgi:hypothetical protein